MYSEDELNRQLMDPTFGALTPQTAVKFQAPGPSPNTNEEAQLPMVPRGQLAAWIKQKQDEEEQVVPSGQSSAADQQRADVSRAIGNTTANTLSGIQNTIGILKPGSANYNQANMAQQQGEQYAKEALGNAPRARNEAIQNLQLGSMQDEKRQKQMQMIQALKMQQDAQNPESNSSKEAQRAMLARLQTYGAVTQNPALRNQLEELTRTVPGMSQARLDALDKQGYIDKLLAQESNERAQGAHNDILAGNAAATNRLGYAQLNEKAMHDRAEEDEKAKAKTKLQMNEDKKVEDEITTLRTAISEMDPLIKRIESGNINNNAAHNLINEGSKKVASWIPGVKSMGVGPDPNLQDLRTNLPLTQGAVEAAVTGSKRYTPQRWKEFTPEPGEGNEVSAQKLRAGTEFLKRVLEEKLGLLHTAPSGAPTSESGLAKSLPPQTIPNAMINVQAKAPIGVPTPAGAIRMLKNGGKAQQQPDGSWKRIE